ncbi:MAG TPA: DUF3794 domain-containing protein [Clostridia bacterium]
MATIVKDLIEISGIADNLPQCPSIFKQFAVQETLVLPDVKPDIKQIIKIVAQIVINSTRVIQTPVGQSLEGQILTGFKLIVEGEIRQKIEYVADECTQSVHAAHFCVPFSTFIVLPSTYRLGTPVHVTGYIEDLCVEPVNERSIFKNLILFLDAAL